MADDPEARNKRDLIALRVAQGWSVRKAAREADVPEATARYWSKDEHFRKLVRELRDDLTSRVVGILTRGAALGAGDLVRLMRSPGPEADREFKAKVAFGLIDRLVTVARHADLAAELAELRAQVEQSLGTDS